MKPRYAYLLAVGVFALTATATATASAAAEPEPARAQSAVVEVPEAAGRLLELANEERRGVGASLLTTRDDLTSIAAAFARTLAAEGRLRHNQDYLSPASLERLGASRIGENVGFDSSAETAHQRFMSSPAHRANIVDREFRAVGIAVVRDSAGSLFIAADFLAPAGDPPPSMPSPPPGGTAPTRPRDARVASAARAAPRPRAAPRLEAPTLPHSPIPSPVPAPALPAKAPAVVGDTGSSPPGPVLAPPSPPTVPAGPGAGPTLGRASHRPAHRPPDKSRGGATPHMPRFLPFVATLALWGCRRGGSPSRANEEQAVNSNDSDVS